MQYSYISTFKKTGLSLPLITIVKIITLLIIVGYIFYRLIHQKDLLRNMYLDMTNLFNEVSYLYILFPVALVPVNWSLEALKWMALSSKIVSLSFSQSLSGVLSGLSLGFITPQNLGDYAGRILMIKHARRSELIGAVLLGSMLQASISVFFGLFAVLLISEFLPLPILKAILSGFLLLLTVVVGLVLYRKYSKISLFELLPNCVSSFFSKYFGIIRSYSTSEILKIFIFALVRYLVFALQFVWVLVLFGVDLPLKILLAGVNWVYAAKTIIPAFNFLSDLGVREFSALLFFEQFHVDVSKVILASLFIWVINILVPTLIGSFMVLRLKLSAK